jgi:hypothetical protein
MTYLIGGPVRVGKSGLTRLIGRKNNISSNTTDALTSSIGHVMPDSKLWGGTPQLEWEDNFYPFLRRFIKTLQFDYPDYVIEGAPISPRIARKLSEKLQVKAIFIGNSEANRADLKEHMGNNIWLKKLSDEEIDQIALDIIARTKEIGADCLKYDYPFVDLAGNYSQQIQKAYQVLLSQ